MRGRTDSAYEQFEIYPETFQQELLPVTFRKMMSMEHDRWCYLRSDRTVGCVKVSSALSRCARLLAQKYAKNTISRAKIIIPASSSHLLLVVHLEVNENNENNVN